MLEDGFRRLYSNFIVRGIPMLQTEIVVFDVEVQVWKDKLLLRLVSSM